MTKLLLDATNDECKYIIRFLQKKLKTNAAQEICYMALARAIVYTPPNKKGEINTKNKLGQDKFLERCEKMKVKIK